MDPKEAPDSICDHDDDGEKEVLRLYGPDWMQTHGVVETSENQIPGILAGWWVCLLCNRQLAGHWQVVAHFESARHRKRFAWKKSEMNPGHGFVQQPFYSPQAGLPALPWPSYMASSYPLPPYQTMNADTMRCAQQQQQQQRMNDPWPQADARVTHIDNNSKVGPPMSPASQQDGQTQPRFPPPPPPPHFASLQRLGLPPPPPPLPQPLQPSSVLPTNGPQPKPISLSVHGVSLQTAEASTPPRWQQNLGPSVPVLGVPPVRQLKVMAAYNADEIDELGQSEEGYMMVRAGEIVTVLCEPEPGHNNNRASFYTFAEAEGCSGRAGWIPIGCLNLSS